MFFNNKLIFLMITGMSAFLTFAKTDNNPQNIVPRSEEDSIVGELPGVAITAIKQLIPAYSDESLTVMGRETIDRLDLSNIKQLSAIAPNFYMPKYGSAMTSTIYVRGLGTRIDQPVIGLNIDNVPILSKDNFDFQLSDIAKIEVIRGPQNILYGRNTMGGLINITTISPLTYEGLRGSVTYGNRNTWRYDVGGYKRLSERIGLSLTLYGGGTDGYFKNEYNESRVGKTLDFGARFKTIWRTLRGHTLQNSASFSHTSQKGYPYASADNDKVSYNDTCFYRRLSFMDGLTAKGDVGNVNLSAIASFQYLKDNLTLDQDFLPLDYFTLTQRRHEWGLTGDIVASSRKPAGGVYNWLLGAFGFLRRVNMSAPVTFYDYGLTHLIENNANALNPQYPIQWDKRSLLLASDFVMPSKGFSLYHESVARTGDWTFTLGLRWDCEQTKIRYKCSTSSTYTIYDNTGGILIPWKPAIPINIFDHGHLSRTYSQLLPKLSASYELPQKIGNIYGTITRGYKSGGYNTQMFSDVLQQRLMGHLGIAEKYSVDDIIVYAPEKIWNYELGAHLSFLEGRLKGDVSLFWIECYDQQLTIFPEGNLTGRLMANAGRSRSRGVELAFQGQPGVGFSIRASYGFTDARFVNFSDGRNDYSGKHLPYSPSHTLWGGLFWNYDFNNSIVDRLEISADIRGTGEIFWNEANTLRQPFYTILGSSVGIKRGKFTFEFRASNITSTRYSTFYFVSIGNAFLQKGDGFGISATLKVHF